MSRHCAGGMQLSPGDLSRGFLLLEIRARLVEATIRSLLVYFHKGTVFSCAFRKKLGEIVCDGLRVRSANDDNLTVPGADRVFDRR